MAPVLVLPCAIPLRERLPCARPADRRCAVRRSPGQCHESRYRLYRWDGAGCTDRQGGGRAVTPVMERITHMGKTNSGGGLWPSLIPQCARLVSAAAPTGTRRGRKGQEHAE